MAHDFWLAVRRRALPQNLAGFAVQAIDVEALRGLTLDRGDIAVQADFQGRLAGGGDRAGDKDAVAPNDWTGVAEAWYRALPEDVLARLSIPFERRRTGADATGGRSAELRPIRVRRQGGQGQK